ncbi:ABC transporter substrate-binding protein [Paraburkholderia rhizosphaerae]|uniref:Peptide/nickel transport system substrate-binding protein n=1 Tax=Paraburkholderia rhizosphaerae TaxID=480658 RepID=A0A4V3HEP4_9BURK|nr:ABC transporter substrate-binding protein [Paraburkholderia rhizosphaerae]TDY49761.1 peptide/nickel transport system substrate-binding protein [Paraburkholderia rhizosphaerae]
MKKLLLSQTVAALVALHAGFACAADTPKNGGTITITYQNDVSTLDPAIGYDWQNWSLIKSVFDRLMDYKPGTTDLVPSLAESYTVSPDGTVYTFKLRHGVQFTNGREMKASDVKYSLERTVNPKTQSPGASFFASIKGYQEVADGKTTNLAGVKALDDYTVQLTLTRPDATFLQVLALNFASVVPKEAVEQAKGDFGHHPVGSGAFSLASWQLGHEIVFKKNPNYFQKGLPRVDGMTFQIGQDPSVALLRLERGEVDIAGDGVPPAQYLQFRADPRYKGLLVVGSQLETSYLTLKTTLPPFDNLKVRQAVNMAINKDHVIRIINGRAKVANQILPPGMTAFDPAFKGYSYDPAGAKKLLAEAGYAKGFNTELYVMNTDPQPRIAQAIQQDLAQVGIKVEIKSLEQSNIIAAGGTRDKAPMIWSGGMGWLADFPDPSDFYGPILSCSSATPGGWNWALYCNKALDTAATQADSLVKPDQAAERAAKWTGIYRQVMADAPWVPVFNEARITVRSPRMGGADALYTDPVHYPVNYENIWVK